MSSPFRLTEPQQNVIILELYALANRHANDVVRGYYREDIVHDLILRWLDALRGGTWDVPRNEMNELVLTGLRNRGTGDKRKRRRQLKRNRSHFDEIEGAPREWMSQDLELEERRLRGFVDRVASALPRKWLRAHRLVRDDRLSYAAVGKRMRLSVHSVHAFVRFVQKAFRDAMPQIGIEPPPPAHGGRSHRSDGPPEVSVSRSVA